MLIGGGADLPFWWRRSGLQSLDPDRVGRLGAKPQSVNAPRGPARSVYGGQDAPRSGQDAFGSALMASKMPRFSASSILRFLMISASVPRTGDGGMRGAIRISGPAPRARKPFEISRVVFLVCICKASALRDIEA